MHTWRVTTSYVLDRFAILVVLKRVEIQSGYYDSSKVVVNPVASLRVSVRWIRYGGL